MRPLVLVLALLAASASALAQENASNETTSEPPAEPPVAEEPAGPLEIVLDGYARGSGGYFQDATGRQNPTLTVKPGQTVVFLFTSVTGVHNLNVGGVAKSALLSGGDPAERFTWTAPAEEGSLEYWCDPHKAAGMKGKIVVSAAPPPEAGGGDTGEIAGETVDLGQYDPQCQGKVAPAVVTTGITGAPTLEDYIARCKPVETEVVEDSHAADYVIPFSWALVGLGIFGVVWVHKYYKP